ncbi:MAG: response regulator [Candidatus Tantalella remota]|nr:response regulator [Candidatus Tantalella remota]
MARIIVIDDDYDFRSILKTILENEGYEVEAAESGDEGIKMFTENPADLVITDIIMPGKEGIETMVELHKTFPDAKVIAMSGGGFQGPMDYLEGATLLGGALRTFTKPFRMKAMLKAVKELLEDKKS